MTALHSFAQKNEEQAQGATTPSVIAGAEGANRPSNDQRQNSIIRVRTKNTVDFSGIVTHVDPETNIISLKSHGKTITFDMTNPTLTGYRNIHDIKKGDIVSVGYVPSGIQIRKGFYSGTHPETVPSSQNEKNTAQKKVGKAERTKLRNSNSPIRLRDKPRPTSFQDVDNNKDGKISPVELSVIIPDLTMEKFKEYDKNGDGYLDEAEFNAIKKNR
jgi:small nuclear ribonucleoprotein (snRNP)-like protein